MSEIGDVHTTVIRTTLQDDVSPKVETIIQSLDKLIRKINELNNLSISIPVKQPTLDLTKIDSALSNFNKRLSQTQTKISHVVSESSKLTKLPAPSIAPTVATAIPPAPPVPVAIPPTPAPPKPIVPKADPIPVSTPTPREQPSGFYFDKNGVAQIRAPKSSAVSRMPLSEPIKTPDSFIQPQPTPTRSIEPPKAPHIPPVPPTPQVSRSVAPAPTSFLDRMYMERRQHLQSLGVRGPRPMNMGYTTPTPRPRPPTPSESFNFPQPEIAFKPKFSSKLKSIFSKVKSIKIPVEAKTDPALYAMRQVDRAKNNLVRRATLRINADTKDATGAVSRLQRVYKRIPQRLRVHIESIGGSVATSSLESVVKGLRRVKQGHVELSKEQEETERRYKHIAKQAAAFMGTFILIRGTQSVFRYVRSYLTEYSSDLMNAKSRLNAVKKESADVASFFDKVSDSAYRSYSSISATADAVAKMGAANSELFKTEDELIRYTESINKMFINEGVQQQQRESVLFNLAQAMSVGVFRGQDLNAVQANMPEMLRVIERYMDWAEGSAKPNIEAMGGLPVEELKNAILAQSRQIDEKFLGMNMTFADWMQRFRTTVERHTSLPIVERLEEFFNSERFKTFFTNFADVMGKVTNVFIMFVDGIITAFNFVYDNWSLFVPIVFLASTALIVLTAAMFKYAMGATIAAVASAAWTAPLWGAILAAGLLVVGIYAMVKALNMLLGTDISATAAILGAIALSATVVLNVLKYLVNYVLIFAEFLWNAFDNPLYAMQQMSINFQELVLGFIGGMLGIDNLREKIIDKVLEGWDWIYSRTHKWLRFITDGLNGVLRIMNRFLKTDFEIVMPDDDWLPSDTMRDKMIYGGIPRPDDYKEIAKFEYSSTVEAVNWAADVGESIDNIGNKASSAVVNASKLDSDALAGTDKYSKANNSALNKIAANTGATASGVNNLGGDGGYDYLKEIAIRNTINQSAPISIDMRGASFSNSADEDRFIRKLTKALKDSVNVQTPRGDINV